jgi:hypothetical protein
MAAKFDKQQLIKHHFWILLGVFALFGLLLIILVPVLIGGEIKEKETAYAAEVTAIDSASKGPTNQGTVDKLTEQTEKLGGRKDTIWREMYKSQGGMLTFPSDLAAKLDKLAFGAEIDPDSRSKFREEIYLDTYREMAPLIDPTEYVGGWPAILQPIEWKNGILPTTEDVWLALEDMCVRRELLGMLREGNMTSARMDLAKDQAGVPTSTLGPKFSRRFVSRIYQIDLVLNEKGRGTYVFGGKIKNISGQRQKIFELFLDVWVNQAVSVGTEAKPTLLRFSMSDLAAGQELALPEFKATLNLRPEEIYKVQLHHTFKTVPIKQLLALELGHNPGHRKYKSKLEAAAFSKKDESAGSTAPPASGPPMGGMGGFGGGNGPITIGSGGGGGGGGGASGGTGGDAGEKTTAGLLKTRYIEKTDQVRRMPVAIEMVIDQRYTPDILAAFSNSERLRFQITQYHWKRHHGSLAGSKSDADGDAAPAGGGPAPAGPMPGGGGGAGPIRVGGGGAGGGPPMGGFGPPAGGQPAGPGINPGMGGMGGGGVGQRSAGDQTPPNLIELTIYGIANLYERPQGDMTTPVPTPAEQPKPGDAKPAEAPKPGDAKPAETPKPADGKPAETPKPGEAPKTTPTKPAEPAKPEATKPDAPKNDPGKPGDTKPSAPTTPDKPKAPDTGKPENKDNDKPKDK